MIPGISFLNDMLAFIGFENSENKALSLVMRVVVERMGLMGCGIGCRFF